MTREKIKQPAFGVTETAHLNIDQKEFEEGYDKIDWSASKKKSNVQTDWGNDRADETIDNYDAFDQVLNQRLAEEKQKMIDEFNAFYQYLGTYTFPVSTIGKVNLKVKILEFIVEGDFSFGILERLYLGKILSMLSFADAKISWNQKFLNQMYDDMRLETLEEFNEK